MIEVVVGILLNDKKEVLIAKRQPHQHLGDCWEFPGGKIEAGEDPCAALKREFQEELGIDVLNSSFWFAVSHDYGMKKVNLNIHKITDFSGQPKGCEGQIVRWVEITELFNLPLPPANHSILLALQQEHPFFP